jgi:hypothetical protein
MGYRRVMGSRGEILVMQTGQKSHNGVSAPSVDSTATILRGIRTEIMAGCVLFPKDDADMAHNNASKRAAEIIDKYIAGKGLFQR